MRPARVGIKIEVCHSVECAMISRRRGLGGSLRPTSPVITWFDNFCLLLRRDAQSQLVYKHAISTIMPGAPIQLFDPEQNQDSD